MQRDDRKYQYVNARIRYFAPGEWISLQEHAFQGWDYAPGYPNIHREIVKLQGLGYTIRDVIRYDGQKTIPIIYFPFTPSMTTAQ